MLTLKINGKEFDVDVDPDTKLLWILRERLNLTGTKYGCGVGACGSCTVLVDSAAKRSCLTPVGSLEGASITTVEGVPEDHPVKKAWTIEQVPQCGYCQPGQIMQAVALLQSNKQPMENEIIEYMNGNLCRCGTYPRIMKAIKRASSEMKSL